MILFLVVLFVPLVLTCNCANLTIECQYGHCLENNTCQIVPRPANFMCREKTGDCGSNTFCDGVSLFCPTEDYQEQGTICRHASGFCGSVSECDGSSSKCPEEKMANQSQCSIAKHPCGLDGVCDGVHSWCPNEEIAPEGTICAKSHSSCSLGRLCNGIDWGCPDEILVQNGSVCRPAVDSCDVPEFCDGLSPHCPPDVRKDHAYLIRCGFNLFICGPTSLSERGIIIGKDVIFGGIRTGPTLNVSLLPWPSCISEKIRSLNCPQGGILSLLIMADCINGTWIGKKRLNNIDLLLASYPINTISKEFIEPRLASCGIENGVSFVVLVALVVLFLEFLE